MKIAVANDHAGTEFKKRLVKHLKNAGYEIEDFGSDKTDSCDYPDFGILAVKSVAENKNDRAILICTNGIGMSILANKIPTIRAALVYNENTAIVTRKHHDSNVLCLGAKEFQPQELLKFVDVWLKTEFEGGRHQRRISKINKLDNQ